MSFQIPENLTELDSDGLDAALASAADEFSTIAKKSDEDLTDDEIARMEELSNFAQTVEADKSSRAEAIAARAEKLSSLRSAMDKKDEADKAEDKPAEGEAPAGEVIVDGEVAPVDAEIPAEAELPVEPIIEDIAPVEVAEDAIEDEEKKKETEAMASNTKIAAAAAANQAPAEGVVVESAFSLTAAADVQGVSAGTKFDTLKDAGVAISSRLRALPNGVKNVHDRKGALVFRNGSTELRQSNTRDDLQLLLEAGQESRLKGGNLVAAGGWGAPSTQLLDFCELETAENLIDVPEVIVDRGGLNYTKGPSFADVLASSTGFWDMTEAVAEAGTELKTSLRPEVPDFTDVRLDAVGTMMECGLLLRAGWPELVERYASMALLAHQIKMHAKTIKGIQAYTGAAVDVTNGFGNAIDIFHVLDVVGAGERQRNAMPRTGTLEVLLPMWVISVVRADLANRTGVDFLSITDAQIEAMFSERNFRVQWLNHYQNLTIDGTKKIAIEYPDTLEIIMYPAGTYVNGVAEVLTLDTVYDSTNLKKNDYVHLFTEQGLAVTNPCNDGRRFKVALNITGRTGAADIKNELFKTATP